MRARRLPPSIAGSDAELLQCHFRLNCLQCAETKVFLNPSRLSKNMQSNLNKPLMESYLELGEISLDLGDLGPQAVTSCEDLVLDLDLDEIIEPSAITA